MSQRPTLLVVDDDLTVRQVLLLALERAGFRVIAAEDGRHALELLDGEPQGVDLVLTDVVMPEMDGVTLAERIVARAGTTRVMFMSGYVHDPKRLDAALGRRAPFVQKPFDIDALTLLIRAELMGS